MAQILHSDLLDVRLGGSPSFHDAEVQALRLDSGQRSDGEPILEIEVHLFVTQPAPDGFSFTNHTLATLEFRDIEDLELSGFWHQNVLSDLLLRDVSSDRGTHVEVEFWASSGLTGGFRCRQAAVIAAEPFTPGPHSVYGR